MEVEERRRVGPEGFGTRDAKSAPQGNRLRCLLRRNFKPKDRDKAEKEEEPHRQRDSRRMPFTFNEDGWHRST